MNNTSFNTKNTGSKMNTTTVLVLIIAALPILLFALTQMFPPTVDTPAKDTTSVSDTKANRVSAAERRAQRAEARKAKKAEKAATVTTMQTNSFPAPMEPMEFNGFGPGMGFDNGMAMGPGGFGGGFGPGGFGGGFGPGGFGGGFGPGMF